MSEPAADPRPAAAPDPVRAAPGEEPGTAAPAPAEATPGTSSSTSRGQELLRAVAVMEALRAPDGDAWTRTQTHASLARYLLEEAHEVLEVIEDPAARGPGALADELGDLLFQILFHARLGEEEEPAWDVDTVARSFVAKMERRNPHVFGPEREAALADPGDVEAIIAQWHAVKAAEKSEAAPSVGGRRDAWSEGIPARLPALQRAAKMVHRARSAGQLPELLAAADRAADPGPDELGRTLLDLVVAAEAQDVDPESALRSLLARIGSAEQR